jgi:hypothetical protein
MPHLTCPITPRGPLVDLVVGVSGSRREVLERNNFPVPPRVRVRALIDTGSDVTGLARHVFEQLEVRPHGQTRIRTPSTTADQPHFVDQYVVSIGLPGTGLELHLPQLEVIDSGHRPDDDYQGIVGRDFLAHCLFVYDGEAGTFALAF